MKNCERSRQTITCKSASQRMWVKVLVVMALGAIIRVQNAEAVAQNSTTRMQTSEIPRSNLMESNTSSTRETLEAAPTITSVHQVWTSSSRGSLDELSPEMISKLRNDVPFLAAYALRPRLVGAISPQNRQNSDSQLEPGASQQNKPLETSSSERESLVVAGAQGSSSKSSARQVAPGGSLSKLGDFSEYNVETSSTSRSEHHQKQKTSLKRQKTNGNKVAIVPFDSERRQSRGSPVVTSQSARKKRARTQTNRSKVSKSTKKRSSRRIGRGRQARDRLRLKNSKLNIIRKGRYVQESSIEADPNSNGLDVEMRALGRDTTTLMTNDKEFTSSNDNGGLKGGPSGVKGGSNEPKKPPFFGAKKPPVKSSDVPKSAADESDEESLANGGDAAATSGGSGQEFGEDTKQLDDGLGEEEVRALDDDEPVGEPKRVGDDDIEEDGDTVLVEPKSDGVDDDPPLPTDNPDESSDSNGIDGDVPSSQADNQDAPEPELAAEGDPRGERVDRERPNPVGPRDRERADDNEDHGDGSHGQAAGAGIGATNGAPSGSGDQSDEDRNLPDSVDKEDRDRSGKGGSSVEFANGNDEGDEQGGKEAARDQSGRGADKPNEPALDTSGGFKSPTRGTKEARNGFDERRKVSGHRPSQDGGQTDDRGIEEDDLDYRDEMSVSRKSGAKESTQSGGKGVGVDVGDHAGAGKKSPPTTPHKPKEKDCDDGSYDHHDEHHGHAHHHDTIDWLRGAIPGEPDEDYPILSRVNVSNFKCSEQRHPGYYADVESKCQIFHICQADGRQDSFLCPNGTIFSQKTLVCLWWNGFNCEDAPKLYHLNELLYKTAEGTESPKAADTMGPLDDGRNKMAPLKPRGMSRSSAPAAAGEDDSPIEGLVKMMRGGDTGKHETENIGEENGRRVKGTRRPDDGRRLEPVDEATIQRKSTILDETAAGLPETATSSSRIQSRDNIPRRKRRASARQAPPKLNSKRLPRNSRRRKLRHGIKPRRRA